MLDDIAKTLFGELGNLDGPGWCICVLLVGLAVYGIYRLVND
ncbi:hypothetical protein [Stackebrandtia soli]